MKKNAVIKSKNGKNWNAPFLSVNSDDVSLPEVFEGPAGMFPAKRLGINRRSVSFAAGARSPQAP